MGLPFDPRFGRRTARTAGFGGTFTGLVCLDRAQEASLGENDWRSGEAAHISGARYSLASRGQDHRDSRQGSPVEP